MKTVADIFPSFFLLLVMLSCSEQNTAPAESSINDINLKKGAVITCGPPDEQFGQVAFETSCTESQKDFNLGMALLHSFEYDESEKVFAGIIDKHPNCAMAYWGVAMSNYHPLWAPPTPEELKKGAKAIAIAQSMPQPSARETDYINAIGSFYTGWEKTDHKIRSGRFEKAMENIYAAYPKDKEAAIFYALSLGAAADPADKTFAKQKKAFQILQGLYPSGPDHPGIVHYIIHSYDYPELATLALPAARKYAAIAPSSAHAQHMPSHIFTRLGLWEECIASNVAATASAKCYAESSGIKGHWDEELHGMDYLVYAHLQKGENDLAKKQFDYLNTIKEVHPANFKVAYAFAAIPSRYVLENKNWTAAANLEVPAANFQWNKFPWQKAIIHFTRMLGAVHTKDLAGARSERKHLQTIHDTLLQQKDAYKANQVAIQLKSGDAWLALLEGKNNEAVTLMQAAAIMEDNTGKHPVTPSEVIPARELLADMLLQLDQPGLALKEYEASLQKNPNRFNSLYGAAVAAEKSNDQKAGVYYQQLLAVTGVGVSRPEVATARTYLKKQKQ